MLNSSRAIYKRAVVYKRTVRSLSETELAKDRSEFVSHLHKHIEFFKGKSSQGKHTSKQTCAETCRGKLDRIKQL